MPRSTNQTNRKERHDIMSKLTIVRLVSDLSAEEYTPGETGETIEFSLDGKDYEIDVTSPEGEKLRDALAVYVAHGRQVKRGRKASAPATRSGGDVKEARAWLQANGYPVKEKGRIPADMMDAYRSNTPVQRNVETTSAPALELVTSDNADNDAEQDETGVVTDGLFQAPVGNDVQPDGATAEGSVDTSDAAVMAWHEEQGKEVKTTKDGRPNSATRRRYLRAHGLAS